MSVPDRIRPALGAPLRELGLLVEDVSVTPAGRRRVVRIAVDRDLTGLSNDQTEPVASLTLDEVADAARAIGDALDHDGALGEQPYTLEVTSPGVDRPLTEPRHFRRNVTRLVALTPHQGDKVTGRLVRAGEAGVTVVVPAERKTPERTVEVAYADLARAVVQVDFSRSSGPADEADHGDDTDHDDHNDHNDQDPGTDAEPEET